MYVRKYDPPLLIGTEEFSVAGAMMKDIMGYNIDSNDLEMTDKSIMKHVKDNLKEERGFINIMDMYSLE
jgi:hypothetical protein